MECKSDLSHLRGDGHLKEVSLNFNEEEFYWRSLASYVWFITYFPIIFGLFILVANVSIFSPFAWICSSFSSMFSFVTLGTVILLQIICILATISHARALSVHKIHHTSNLKFVMFLFRPKQLINSICFSTASIFITLIFQNYVNADESNSQRDSFVLLLGLFSGPFYTIIYYSKHYYVAQFPVIQQSRLFRMKKTVKQCFYNSLMITLKILQIYYPLYVLITLVPSNIMPALLTNRVSNTSFFATLMSVCDIWMFWLSLNVCLTIIFTFQFSNLLLQIFNTQPYAFPIYTGLEHKNKTLADAMESNDVLVKHLACLDLYLLSRYDGARRLKLFALSSPGDQPHSWNRISTECLNIIKKIRLHLVEEHGRNQEVKYRDGLKSPPAQTIGSQGLFSDMSNFDDKKDGSRTSWFAATSAKSLSKSPGLEVKKTQVSIPNNDAVLERSVDLFDHLHTSIWCMEGLCNLVAASLKEDKYGVVQQKLPDIIIELLLMLEACKRFTKTSFNVPSTNHSHHVEAAQINNSHVTSLKIALKASLYTVTETFGHHISAIRLPADLKGRLITFVEYGE